MSLRQTSMLSSKWRLRSCRTRTHSCRRGSRSWPILNSLLSRTTHRLKSWRTKLPDCRRRSTIWKVTWTQWLKWRQMNCSEIILSLQSGSPSWLIRTKCHLTLPMSRQRRHHQRRGIGGIEPRLTRVLTPKRTNERLEIWLISSVHTRTTWML